MLLGHLTYSISGSFELLNSPNGTNFPHTMSFKSEHLTRKEHISNAFNSLFADFFNDVLHLVSKETSSKTVKLVELLQSLITKLILNAIQRTKCSSTVTSDSFRSKNLYFAQIFSPVCSFNYSMNHCNMLISSYLEIFVC